ncbi:MULTISPECIES: hypothetical protein [Kitasatospora]|uniref:MerR family transcriptional regulator n=1 Tax=Kitasatospora cathayae TaxID=3004092 RepID=A0ABY7Q6E9_9ACTN|nr:hypothetical protein [Kitasatospora sp. HUAS 3-15]WBP88263.1 hypothetical protein O1G21_22115 [Kitasatospora sp. HUAS 3-15]
MNGRHTGRRLVPTELAALAAGVSVATIRKWASRGRLTRYGSPARAQYDLDEIIDGDFDQQQRRCG